MNKSVHIENILFLLNKLGIKPSPYSKLIGMNQSTFQRILSGETKYPSSKYLAIIAKSFQVSLDDLMTKKLSDSGLQAQEPGTEYQIVANYGNSHKISIRDNMEIQIMEWSDLQTSTSKIIVVNQQCSPLTIALVMDDASMEPKIPQGCTFIVDPEQPIEPGDFVISKPINGRAIAGQYVRDAAGYSLMPSNNKYDKIKNLTYEDLFGKIVGFTQTFD